MKFADKEGLGIATLIVPFSWVLEVSNGAMLSSFVIVGLVAGPLTFLHIAAIEPSPLALVSLHGGNLSRVFILKTTNISIPSTTMIMNQIMWARL